MFRQTAVELCWAGLVPFGPDRASAPLTSPQSCTPAMTYSTGSMIAASARLALVYNQRLTQDIPAGDFAAMARVGDTTIDANHPAFILGHLAIYPARIVSELGGDASGIEPSERDDELFSPKASCVDDPDGSIYPGKDELIQRTVKNYEAAIEALESAPNDAFSVANSNEAMRGKFASVGAMHGFYVGGHFMMHMGQLSTWRRIMGLGSA